MTVCAKVTLSDDADVREATKSLAKLMWVRPFFCSSDRIRQIFSDSCAGSDACAHDRRLAAFKVSERRLSWSALPRTKRCAPSSTIGSPPEYDDEGCRKGSGALFLLNQRFSQATYATCYRTLKSAPVDSGFACEESLRCCRF